MALFPATPKPRQWRLVSRTMVREDMTHSMKRQRRASDAQRWQLSVEYPVLTRAQMEEFIGFAVAQQVQFARFDYPLPPRAVGDTQHEPRGAGGGTPVVKGASQTGRTLITDGWPASTAVLLRGDVFQLTNHKKLYRVTEDETSDGAGDLTLNFEPPLLQSPADNEAISIIGIAMQVSLLNPEALEEVKTEQPWYEGFVLEMLEDV